MYVCCYPKDIPVTDQGVLARGRGNRLEDVSWMPISVFWRWSLYEKASRCAYNNLIIPFWRDFQFFFFDDNNTEGGYKIKQKYRLNFDPIRTPIDGHKYVYSQCLSWVCWWAILEPYFQDVDYSNLIRKHSSIHDSNWGPAKISVSVSVKNTGFGHGLAKHSISSFLMTYFGFFSALL